MTVKAKKLVIIGSGEFGLIAREYFSVDSDYEVVAFSAERDFITDREIDGLPVVDFEMLTERYPPSLVDVHVAVTYTQLNRVRTRLYRAARAAGYACANYISSHAFVWRNAKIGDNVFIFENNVVQPFAQIGNNVVLWSGNHIGHRSIISDNCYISSHVVVSGFCRIGESCFVGVNASFADHVEVGRDCLIGMAAVVNRSCEAGGVYVGNPARAAKVGALRYFKVTESC
jgi:sugar O-acyltransferase (sialic acid O-acetyltransferase NeuD family)